MFVPSEFRLLIPEEVLLSELDYALAHTWVSSDLGEASQWQSYLNGLGLLAFEQWLQEHHPNAKLQRHLEHLHQVAYLNIGEFKLCLMAQTDYLDEQALWPQEYIDQPDLAAHFYGIVEVDEENETVILRGVSRRDQLQSAAKQAGQYQFSLEHFDGELTHFLADCRHLVPSAIPLPTNMLSEVGSQVSEGITQLSNWFDGVLAQGWQALDQLATPEAQFAFATRNLSEGIQAGKLLDLSLSLGPQQVVLQVTLAPTEDGKVRIQTRLIPFDADYLPTNLEIILKSRGGKVLQSVTSRQQDSYIQLKPFKGTPGKVFQLEVSGDGCTVSETFAI